MRSFPWLAAVLVACAALPACAPRYDWREIRADEDHFLAMMPARPDRMTRPIDLDGMPVTMTMQGAHAHDISTILDKRGIAVRAGTHCAMPLMDFFGVSASARASFAMYNTEADVDALVDGLAFCRELFA